MRSFLALLVLVAMVADVSAQSRREQRRMERQERRYGWHSTAVVGNTVLLANPAPVAVTPAPAPLPSWRTEETKSETKAAAQECADAMDEVNAKRAQKGLPPLQKDPLLSQAAFACAKQRASRNIHGHLESDFAYLPPGGNATVAGCGALDDSWGWETCAYDSRQYTVGGAAWVRGPGGLRFMHFFGR